MNKSLFNFKFFILLIVISIIFLSACDPTPVHFDYDELKEQVEKVEIITYDNDNPQRIKDKSLILPFDFDRMVIIEELDESLYEDFIDEFSNIPFITYGWFYDSPTGINLKITYKNGDFILLSSAIIENGRHYFSFITIYDGEGNVKDAQGDFDSREIYVNFINKYFDTKIA